MTTVRISAATRRKIIGCVETGGAIQDAYLRFLGNDLRFVQAVIKVAIQNENRGVLDQLGECCVQRKSAPSWQQTPPGGGERRAFNRHQMRKLVSEVLRSLPPMRVSPRHRPTGQSFRDFLVKRGYCDREPTYPAIVGTNILHPYSGGGPGLGKRA